MQENESKMSENEMSVYEISFIFDDKLDENKAIEKLNVLKELIASNNGSFISEETPYKRELAYEMIRVQNNVNIRFNEGYFGWIKFEMSAENISIINKKLKLDEEVVRFLIVKAERGNDVFTKNKIVLKSDNTQILNTNASSESLDSKELDSVNIDTTNMEEIKVEDEIINDDKIIEDVIEETK